MVNIGEINSVRSGKLGIITILVCKACIALSIYPASAWGRELGGDWCCIGHLPLKIILVPCTISKISGSLVVFPTLCRI